MPGRKSKGKPNSRRTGVYTWRGCPLLPEIPENAFPFATGHFRNSNRNLVECQSALGQPPNWLEPPRVNTLIILNCIKLLTFSSENKMDSFCPSRKPWSALSCFFSSYSLEPACRLQYSYSWCLNRLRILTERWVKCHIIISQSEIMCSPPIPKLN